MRKRTALLLCLLLAGCATPDLGLSTSWFGQDLTATLADDHVVQMDVALVEETMGDHFLNQELWTLVDDQVVPFEQKATLDDNGFRVGQLGGIPPAGLQSRLTSDRTCTNPWHLQVRPGEPTLIPLGPGVEHCQYLFHKDEKETPVRLEHAQCFIEAIAAPAPDGRTRLRLTPLVKSGRPAASYQPAADLSGWMVGEKQPTERYPSLGWEITLAANEYLVVGTRFEWPGRLGHQCFISASEKAPKQRVLVLRAGHRNPGVAEDDLSVAASDDRISVASPPLALQASLSNAPNATR